MHIKQTSFIKPQDSTVRVDSRSQASDTPQSGSIVTSKGLKLLISYLRLFFALCSLLWRCALYSCFIVYIGASDKEGNALLGFTFMVNGQKKIGAQVRPSTSGSSREMSEDDEVEGENETMENMDPADAKRVRR